MFNLKNLFSRALLALMLVSGAGAALAGPTYHVTIDTREYDGTGAIVFELFGYDSQVATAFLSNFSGDFLSGSEAVGDVGGSIGSGLVIRTGEGYGSFAQALNLGQRFGFDLRFDTGLAADPVSFNVGLFSDTKDQYLGEFGTLAFVALTPGQPDEIYVDGALARVSEVPEPATLASIMLGLTLMGSTLRARRKK